MVKALESKLKKRVVGKWVASATGLIGAAMLSNTALAFTTIGFEGLENGEIVNDQFKSQGVTIRAENDNKPFDFGVVFDTRGVNNAADPDLTAPFFDFIQSDFASPSVQAERSFTGDVRDGQNGKINPGNILIIQENDEGCKDGICDNPDDEAIRPNGAFEIEFDSPVFLSSIDFFDVESKEDGSPNEQITLTTVTGSEIFFTPNTGGEFNYNSGIAAVGQAPVTNFGNVNSWDRKFFNVAQVTMIRINMGGSGGIDNIRFASRVPAPASLAMLGLGLLVLRRRTAK